MYDIKNGIENLVWYGVNVLGLPELDAVYARNQLMALFSTDDVGEVTVDDSADLQSDILDPMLGYAENNALFSDGELIRFETKLMGFVTPSPSFVAEMFDLLYKEVSPEEATDYLNDLSHDNNYIRMRDVSKNLRWNAENERGDVVVTINLSKPEKSAEQVAREKLIPNQKYPKCMLCYENLGYVGSVKHPARQTLRIIPVELGGEEWFIQMSPYVYYDNHLIALAYPYGGYRNYLQTPHRFRRYLPPLLLRLQRRPADCRRFHPLARPLPRRRESSSDVQTPRTFRFRLAPRR